MASADVTLMQMVDFDPHLLTPDQVEALDANAAMRELRKRVAHPLRPSLWPAARRAVADALAPVLRLRLADVLVAGWNEYRELAKYKDREEYPPDKIVDVALGEHTITSKHEPRVEILVNGKRFAELHFEVEIEMEIDTATLEIQDAKIKSVSTGECEATCTLRCEGVTLAQSSRTFELPGTLSFGEGIPIA
jgi:hypothetical protein